MARNQPILLPGEESSKGPGLDSDIRIPGLSTVPSLNIKTNLTLSDITVGVEMSLMFHVK